MRRTVTGFKIRERRRALGLTQSELALRVGISASYMNLIENNKRPIAGKRLNRIASELGVAVDEFDGVADRRLVDDLVGLSSEPLLEPLSLGPQRAADLAGQYPNWARALVRLHRSWHDSNQTVAALSDRLNQDPFLGESIHGVLTHVAAIRSASEILEGLDELEPEDQSRFLRIVSDESLRLADVSQALAHFFDRERMATRSVTPADEVDDFLQQHDNHFPELEEAAARIHEAAGLARGSIESRLARYLRRQWGVRVAMVAEMEDENADPRARSAYAADQRRMALLSSAPPATRRFELGRLVAHLGCGEQIARTVASSTLLHSSAARGRATRALQAYLAAALLLPYDAFFSETQAARYDIDHLCHHFGASFEQVCHRLTTLKKPGREGVRFGFMRSDPAGYITKRFPLPTMPLPRYGNACPLWAVYRAFQTPGEILRDLAEFPDGRRYFFLAHALERQRTTYGATRQSISLMLVCESIHADRLVYSDGLDLSPSAPATPVGPSCRLCPRSNCPSRQENPIISR